MKVKHHENQIVNEIHAWIQLLKKGKFEGGILTANLCHAYNWATNPNALRTYQEHNHCRRLARYCHKQLKKRDFWHETENGKMIMD